MGTSQFYARKSQLSPDSQLRVVRVILEKFYKMAENKENAAESLAVAVEKVDIKDTEKNYSEQKVESEEATKKVTQPENVNREVTEPEESPNALKEQDQDENTAAEVTCAFCKKASPTKRCSKRHPKCLKKMFCNEACETQSHKKKDTGAVKPASTTAKVAAKKKKAKKENRSDFGAMWWLNQEC